MVKVIRNIMGGHVCGIDFATKFVKENCGLDESELFNLWNNQFVGYDRKIFNDKYTGISVTVIGKYRVNENGEFFEYDKGEKSPFKYSKTKFKLTVPDQFAY